MTMKTATLIHHLRFPLPLLMFGWWRHDRLLMASQLPDDCGATTWQVISNSLDIDFIHGDIHGQSCKKIRFPTQMAMYTEYPVVFNLNIPLKKHTSSRWFMTPQRLCDVTVMYTEAGLHCNYFLTILKKIESADVTAQFDAHNIENIDPSHSCHEDIWFGNFASRYDTNLIKMSRKQ